MEYDLAKKHLLVVPLDNLMVVFWSASLFAMLCNFIKSFADTRLRIVILQLKITRAKANLFITDTNVNGNFSTHLNCIIYRAHK